MQEEKMEEPWTATYRSKRGWLEIPLRELWHYRDLVVLFVRRDFISVYKQTILGPLWYLISPLATSGVFTIIFGKIAKIPTDGLPAFVFFMSGTTCWKLLRGLSV